MNKNYVRFLLAYLHDHYVMFLSTVMHTHKKLICICTTFENWVIDLSKATMHISMHAVR